MKYEGVTFVVDAVRRMPLDVFVASHINAFWQDRDKETREKMLTQAYNLITAKKEKKKK